MDDEARARAEGRRSWPIRKLRLEDEGADELVHGVSAGARVAMVWELTTAAYALRGQPIPTYTRSEMPGKMLRGLGPG